MASLLPNAPTPRLLGPGADVPEAAAALREARTAADKYNATVPSNVESALGEIYGAADRYNADLDELRQSCGALEAPGD